MDGGGRIRHCHAGGPVPAQKQNVTIVFGWLLPLCWRMKHKIHLHQGCSARYLWM
jgi:hypothetical protein